MGTCWTITKTKGGWRLERNGKPCYVNGAVAEKKFSELAGAGANAVRTQARKNVLDRAHKHGLAALVNLHVRGERNGLDWNDAKQVKTQTVDVLKAVKRLKDHPAVMMWNLGNELDYIPPGRPYHARLWERLNDLAGEVKRVDPNHPVCTSVGTGRFDRKIEKIARACSALDVLGINAFADMEMAAGMARKHWPKPFLFSTWGPTAHWQAPKTPWEAPIEQSSSDKAQVLYERYYGIIRADRGHCLGSFVSYWGEKQETTHTWYGLYRDGMRTESIGIMTRIWSGAWPAKRAPVILGIMIEEQAGRGDVRLAPSSTNEARVYAYDPDQDNLSITWDIRPEVVIPRKSYAGSLEKPAQPLPGLILESEGTWARFRAPQGQGAYRLFVQVSDDQGCAGYANVPFLVGR